MTLARGSGMPRHPPGYGVRQSSGAVAGKSSWPTSRRARSSDSPQVVSWSSIHLCLAQGKHEDGGGSAVHGGFVARVILLIVVVNSQTLKGGERVGFGNGNSFERFENALINRAIHQAAGNGTFGQLHGHEMRIFGIDSA